MSREAVLDLLAGAARYLDGLADAAGVRTCPAHGVEHLGKSAYRIHMGLALHATRGEPLDPVRHTALRLARTCRKYPHPEARAHLFFERWPDPWNCSNHLIDSGAICDALGKLLIEAPDLLEGGERELVRDALERSATTYLWAAALDKPVPAQCLWGALGMARAAVALGRSDLADRARAALTRAYESLRPDGSWSYYTAIGPGAGEPGSEDASAFYHSRCIGFALEILTLVGDDARAEPHRTRLTRALAFLLALHRADGRKCRAWEAKLWYFEGAVETASLSFDVHALLLAERVFGGGIFAARAERSLALLFDARAADGSITSGAPRAFQCRSFWTAHTGLLTSVLNELGDPDEPPRAGASAGAVRGALFADAGLARLETRERVVLVRGRRPGPSPGFGGLCGGGALVSHGVAGAESDRAEFTPLAADRAGEFVVPGALRRLPLRPGGVRWLVFSRWRWRCELRARGLRAALGLVRGTLRELRLWWGAAAASHFAGDVELDLDPAGEVITARGTLAAVDGTLLPGTRTTRRYRLLPEGLLVSDLLESELPLARVLYRLPIGATDLRVDDRPENGALVERRGARRLQIDYRSP